MTKPDNTSKIKYSTIDNQPKHSFCTIPYKDGHIHSYVDREEGEKIEVQLGMVTMEAPTMLAAKRRMNILMRARQEKIHPYESE
jgi:hypothetical protein